LLSESFLSFALHSVSFENSTGKKKRTKKKTNVFIEIEQENLAARQNVFFLITYIYMDIH